MKSEIPHPAVQPLTKTNDTQGIPVYYTSLQASIPFLCLCNPYAKKQYCITSGNTFEWNRFVVKGPQFGSNF